MPKKRISAKGGEKAPDTTDTPTGTSEYAGVFLLDVPYSIDREYTYLVPRHLRSSIDKGCFVTVPFGGANRKRLAVVNRVFGECDLESVKPIASVCTRQLSLDAEMMGLCEFMKEHTLCTVGDAIHAMLPSAALSRLVEYYRPAEREKKDDPRIKYPRYNEHITRESGIPEKIKNDTKALLVYDYIESKGHVSSERLRQKFGKSYEDTVKKLCTAGLVVKELEVKSSPKSEISYVVLCIPAEEATALVNGGRLNGKRITSEKHKAILSVLAKSGEYPTEKLCSECNVGAAQIKSLSEKGIIITEKRLRDEFDMAGSQEDSNGSSAYKRAPIPKDTVLNDEQQSACDELVALASSGAPKAALLYGVTGSGKTSVIMSVIDNVLEKGKGAILLLPEISLTPQTLNIFCQRYGDRISVIHSGLSQGERHEAYQRIRSGRSDLVIGTRSAIFAPVKDLGLIVIDEEQEHTYKSDKNPKYHARDIARWRCAKGNALMLLASATPSVESYSKAIEGKYSLVKLTKRYGKAELPKVSVVDIRHETAVGNLSPFGTLLTEALMSTYSAGEQAILFLNRRGYNNYISCRECGTTVSCPGCSVAMTYHTHKDSYDEGYLVCHWCGRKMNVPNLCSQCGSHHLAKMGYGIQKVEQELKFLLPDATILRMDADTTSSKSAYDEVLGKFRRKEAQILVGTQMVTKGHDFPDVTLVGVLLADMSLYLDDYRAQERTFSLLTQVIGRSGRSGKAGLAVIQTNNPDNEIIKLAQEQDYETFFEREMRLRKALVFPPYCDIVLLTLTHAEEKELALAATRLYEKFNELSHSPKYKDQPFIVFGPFEAPVYKVEGKFRMRLVVKCRLNRESRALFSEILSAFSKNTNKPILSIDLNPNSL